MLAAGKRVMVLSAGALLPRPDLIELADSDGGQIIVPTGALLGLDAVTAAAEGEIQSVRMMTRKPPNGLAGAPYLVAERHFGRRAERAKARVCRHARARPPRAFRRTSTSWRRSRWPASGRIAPMIEIWADPAITRNCHTHRGGVRTPRGFRCRSRTCPSENPKTGRITALSVVAALRKLQAPLRIGT